MHLAARLSRQVFTLAALLHNRSMTKPGRKA
jgi:hypothetical protein